MSLYSLWFQFGAKNKLKLYVLACLLEDAKAIKITRTQKGRTLCEVVSNKSKFQGIISDYQSSPLLYRLWYSYKAARRFNSIRMH